MHHAGNGRMGAAADVGHRPRNRARHRNAAEQRRGEVGNALRHQFLVGVVPVVCHAIGHPGAQQGFDGPQEGNGKRRSHQILGRLPVEAGQYRRG